MRQVKIVDYVYNLEKRKKNKYVNNIIQKGDQKYLEILNDMLSLNKDFEAISFEGEESGTLPYWNNPWFSGFDACSIYYLIAKHKPKYYLEVGSGNSTKFARLAVTNKSPETKIVSIDPEPRAEIDQICDVVIRDRFENLDVKKFDYLSDNDIVFIDNSHRSLQNSDVNVCFTEFLPILAKGVIFGFHDIFLPYDYPEEWDYKMYNEQYMLATYLLSGQVHDSIILPLGYVSHTDEPNISQARENLCPREFFGDKFLRGGGCFWFRREAKPNFV